MHLKSIFPSSPNKPLELDDLLNDAALRRIEEAIRQAERDTSGEIRVHVDEICQDDPLDHAAYLFSELGMHRTALRNGVLIYLSWADHKLAIIGDAGIHAATGESFWQSTRDTMLAHFREERFVEGIIAGVQMAGQQLQVHFPIQPGDANELTNTVSRGAAKSRLKP